MSDTMEFDRYYTVVAMTERGALSFATAMFGLDSAKARALDAGPADLTRYRDGAREYHVYASAAEMPS